ncbi:hypothetical protein BKA65DRAFT_470917 [Rhexocercosporidium sp. MPI-PUGE-AT-0058]|nr:hypothetical protein BKA65DRAFT_470917 [Rhexocercosporidium sp. MPI-PUGE-AT-0058]
MSASDSTEHNLVKQTKKENDDKDKKEASKVDQVGSSKDAVSKVQDSTIVVDVPGFLPVTQASVAPRSTPPGPTSQATSKNRKIGAKVFLARLADNPNHDPSKKPEVGKPAPEMLRFKLKLTTGTFSTVYKYKFRNHPKWDDKEWVDALYKWRKRILDKVILKEDAKGNLETKKPSKSSPRTRWSFAEIEYLRMEIRKLVRSTGTRLTTKDWTKLAEIHNERFKGKEIHVGEKLARGGVATTTQVIEKRTWNAIYGLYTKFPDMKDIVDEEINGWHSDDEDEDLEKKNDDDASSNMEYESDDDESDEEFYDMEESSDDEDEGRRPGSQPVGGILFEATS